MMIRLESIKPLEILAHITQCSAYSIQDISNAWPDFFHIDTLFFLSYTQSDIYYEEPVNIF